MFDAEVLYSDVKYTSARKNTDGPTPMSAESTYSEVKISKTPSEPPSDSHRAAAAGRSWATPGRVALLVLSVLLTAAVVALGLTFYQNIQTKTSLQKLQEKNEALATNLTNCETKPSSKPPAVIEGGACKCDIGWETHGGMCYFFSTYVAEWEKSRNICSVLGGDLVVINSREEQRFLVTRLRDKMDHPEDKFWIGLTDLEKEGEWLWVDKSRLDTRWEYWIGVDPDNWNKENPDGEDCARMGEKAGAPDLKCWVDKSCKVPQKSICEKKEREEPQTCVRV